MKHVSFYKGDFMKTSDFNSLQRLMRSNVTPGTNVFKFKNIANANLMYALKEMKVGKASGLQGVPKNPKTIEITYC